MSAAEDSGTGPTVPADQDAPAPAPAGAAAPAPQDGDERSRGSKGASGDYGSDGVTQHLLPDEDEYQTVEDLVNCDRLGSCDDEACGAPICGRAPRHPAWHGGRI